MLPIEHVPHCPTCGALPGHQRATRPCDGSILCNAVRHRDDCKSPRAPDRGVEQVSGDLQPHEVALRELWRDLAERGIESGIDWPGIVRILFTDHDAMAAKVAALTSALERTEANFVAAVNGRPVRDMTENLAENRAALRDHP